MRPKTSPPCGMPWWRSSGSMAPKTLPPPCAPAAGIFNASWPCYASPNNERPCGDLGVLAAGEFFPKNTVLAIIIRQHDVDGSLEENRYAWNQTALRYPFAK